jgi:general secretion pathway protein G
VIVRFYVGQYYDFYVGINSRRLEVVYMGVNAARRFSKDGSLGFTLLELLIVIAIIGLLAAYVGPKYFSQIGKSERGVAKSQVEAFSRALGTYRLDVGSFPSTEEGLSALVTKPAGATKWNGPYLDKAVPNDPWGHPYVYRAPGSKGNDFDVISYGKDGQPGGTGDMADITNE